MSNALAITTVTRALALVIEKAAAKVLAGVSVVTSRPDAGGQGGRKIHLFLYQVQADASQRNSDLGSRSPGGELRQRPTVALHLHYLLTFQGDDTTAEPHTILGAVARELHARPILSKPIIQSVSNGDLAASNLAEAIDVVRITPLSISLDELSKIWLMFSQIPYSLSVAYEARVVLIEADETPLAVLPVLYRGPDDRGVNIQLGPYPKLDDYEITLPGAPLGGPRLPSYPAAQLGLQIALSGLNLSGDTVVVRFTHPRLGDHDLSVPASGRTSERILVNIPNDAAAETDWAAGIYLVSARITSGGVTRVSNELPIPFAPAFTAIAPPAPAGAGTDLALTLTCSPEIAKDQRAVLMIAGSEAVAAPPPAQTSSLSFTLRSAPKVTNEFVHLRVDGVDSFVFKQTAPPVKFVLDDSKRITIT
jgi:hypothetical protein